MSDDRSIHAASASLGADQERDWQRHSRLGELLLTRYFDWADEADEFDSIFADHEIWAWVPDPASPDRELGMPDGRPIRYLGRIDQLISDQNDEYWIVEHRVVLNRWASDQALVAVRRHAARPLGARRRLSPIAARRHRLQRARHPARRAGTPRRVAGRGAGRLGSSRSPRHATGATHQSPTQSGDPQGSTQTPTSTPTAG